MASQEYINYYRCPDDGTEWTMPWSCMCDDRCPSCGHEILPYNSDTLSEDETRATAVRPMDG
jgi:hypothetical protein